MNPNAWLVSLLRWVPPAAVWPVASRYVAGEDVPAMRQAVQRLNARGACATVDVLGDFITERSQADQAAAAYHAVLDAIQQDGLDSHISIKLSQMGLLLDVDHCRGLMTELLAHAQDVGTFVRIDMEDSACTTPTLALYRQLRAQFPGVGVVLQAYLRRTQADAEALLADGIAQVRLCKGIYRESRAVAFHDAELIRENYTRVLETLLAGGGTVGIATHDERLVWAGERLIAEHDVPPERVEFQVLYGVDALLERLILEAGHRLRVYVPFGPQWHAYCMRRFRENPKLATYVVKNWWPR